MSSVILANALAGHTPPDVPFKENGEFYDYYMSYESNRYLVYADTTEDLLECLIPGYLDMDEDEKILSRIELAMSVQAQGQGLVINGLDEETRNNLKPWELDVLFHPTTSSPHSWGVAAGEIIEESSGETIDIWYSPVPLILINTGYAPFTDIPRPISALGSSRFVANLYWLEPHDEEEFLESLERVNYIYFARRNGS